MVVRTRIMYLEPRADERLVRRLNVKFLELDKQEPVISGSLLSFYDPKKGINNSHIYHRILQVDVFLSTEEQQAAMQRNVNKPVRVVYYHKVFLDEPYNNNWVSRITNPGEDPFGMELVVTDTTTFWIVGYTPSFRAKIMIPVSRLWGVKDKSLEREENEEGT